MTAIELTQEEEQRRGQLLIEVLGLKPMRGQQGPSPNYRTAWGSKTALGLFRMVNRIVLDGE